MQREAVRTTSAHLALQGTLHKVLTEAQMRNPGYSLRALSRRLGISPSVVSEVLNGKRKPSRKLADRIVWRLPIGAEEAQALIGLFQNTGDAPASHQEQIELSAEHFRLISEWYHFGILSLIKTNDFQDSPVWIAKRLGIKVKEAELALERLVKLGLLRIDTRKRLKPTGYQFKTSDGIRDNALRRAHMNNLALAQRSFERDDLTIRDFSASTMAIDIDKLPTAAKMIREFQLKLSAYLEGGKKRTDVYKICVQLFPLTHKVDNEN